MKVATKIPEQKDGKFKCEICKKFFLDLALHVRKHNMKMIDYMGIFGYDYSTKLASDELTKRKSEHGRSRKAWISVAKDKEIKAHLSSDEIRELTNEVFDGDY